MGCGVSKSELEATAQGYRRKSLRRRNYCDIEEREDESVSYKNCQRRSSVSSTANEDVFLRRIVGNTEKERVMLDSSDNVGLKSISSPTVLENKNTALCFKQPQLETTQKETTTKESTITGSNNKDNVEKHEAVNDRKEENIRTSHVKENSILFSPSSPSFRVYVDNDIITATDEEDNGDEEREEIKSTKEAEKGSETQAVSKRGRRGKGFRNAMHIGGSALGLRGVFVQRGGSAVGRKSNLANGFGHDSTRSIEDTCKLTP